MDSTMNFVRAGGEFDMKRTKAVLGVGALIIVGLALPGSATAAVTAKPAATMQVVTKPVVATAHPAPGHMDTKCSAMIGLL